MAGTRNRPLGTKQTDAHPDKWVEISDTLTHEGPFVAFQFNEDTVFDDIRFIDNEQAVCSGTYTKADQPMLGNYKSVKLTSGTIIAYRR